MDEKLTKVFVIKNVNIILWFLITKPCMHPMKFRSDESLQHSPVCWGGGPLSCATGGGVTSTQVPRWGLGRMR